MSPFNLLFAQAQPDGAREIVDHLARTPLSKVVVGVCVLSVIRLIVQPYLLRTAKHRRSGSYGFVQFTNELLDSMIYAGVLVFMLIRPFGFQAFLIPTGSMWSQLHVNDFILANKLIYRYTDPQAGDVVVFHPPTTSALLKTDLGADGEMKFDFVKRCIGVPGDLIEMKKGVVYRNGKVIEEPYQAYSVCIDNPNHCQEYRKLSPDEVKHVTKPSFKLVNLYGKLLPLNYTEMDANDPSPRVGDYAETSQPYHVALPFRLPNPSDQKTAVSLPAERIPKGMYLMMGDNRNNSYDGRAWGLVSREQIVGRSEFVWWPWSHIQRTR